MTEAGSDRTQVPWPYWMLRYVGSDDQDAMEDLIWSVGGSPPYGGVSNDEAGAVYELIEDYRGPGNASEDVYAKLKPFIKGDPSRQTAVDIFRCADDIQSAADTYGRASVDRGLALSRKAGHRGAEACFLAFLAGLNYREGDVSAARDRALEALEIFLAAADEDPIYEKRVKQMAQNAITFTALAGDRDAARERLHKLSPLLDPAVAEQLRRFVDSRR